MSELRPFNIQVPDQALADVRARLKATRWIDDVFQGDWRYGAPLPFVRALCDHWLNAFDWRALETRLNRERQVVTDIDGLAVHAVVRPSARPDAIPLLLLHGWPGGFLEFVDLYAPLSEPPAGEPAFHVVTPSLPGYAFSGVRPDITPQAIAPMMLTLMERLGYRRFVVHAGNWGAVIAKEMACDHSDRIIGLHLNSVGGSPPPDHAALPLTPQEREWITEPAPPANMTHFAVFSQTPAVIAHGLNDSPAGLAAWIGERMHNWSDPQAPLSLDQMVGMIALYWFTGTIGPSGLLYYGIRNYQPVKERFVPVPTAGAMFPKGLIRIPRSWAERHYNIVQWTVFDRGGHFPAMEAPRELAADLRAFANVLETR